MYWIQKRGMAYRIQIGTRQKEETPKMVVSGFDFIFCGNYRCLQLFYLSGLGRYGLILRSSQPPRIG